MTLNELVDRLDDVFFERASLAFRLASGVQAQPSPWPELPDEVTRTDALQLTTETLTSPRVDEAKRGRLVLLRRYLLKAVVEAKGEALRQELEHFSRQHSFTAIGESWTTQRAAYELPRLSKRESRFGLQQTLSTELLSQHDRLAQRLDLMLESVHALGLTPQSFLEETQGHALPARLAAAGDLIQNTQEAHDDLLAYSLKKVDPDLKAKQALQSDVEHSALAPWLFDLFRKEDLAHAVTRCLSDLGFAPNAEGRITVDMERRAHRDPRASCFELRVPAQIRLLLTPDSGLRSYADWLFQWGLALHRAHVGASLPFVERRLGDRAVALAMGLLFESFLLDERWLQRYLRLTNKQAREAARHGAWHQLRSMRDAAVHSTYSQHMLQQPKWRAAVDEYLPRLSLAMGGAPMPGQAMFEIDAFGDNLIRLDAYALEQPLRVLLRERFNEDFWRNPATGKWLTNFASHGQREDAMQAAKACGSETPSLAEAALHRVAVMGA